MSALGCWRMLGFYKKSRSPDRLRGGGTRPRSWPSSSKSPCRTAEKFCWIRGPCSQLLRFSPLRPASRFAYGGRCRVDKTRTIPHMAAENRTNTTAKERRQKPLCIFDSASVLWLSLLHAIASVRGYKAKSQGLWSFKDALLGGFILVTCPGLTRGFHP